MCISSGYLMRFITQIQGYHGGGVPSHDRIARFLFKGCNQSLKPLLLPQGLISQVPTDRRMILFHCARFLLMVIQLGSFFQKFRFHGLSNW
jgi:hypothetical protein